MRRERVRFLLEALADLPDELAEVVMLRDLDGLDYREIGDFLKLPDGTVKSRLNRARIELARTIRPRLGQNADRQGSVFVPGVRRCLVSGGPLDRLPRLRGSRFCPDSDETGPDAPLPPEDGHPEGCAECRSLVAILNARGRGPPLDHAAASARPAPPVARDPSARLRRPARGGRSFSISSLPVLSRSPEPSPELMGRLRFLPTRAGAVGEPRLRPAGWRRWLADWRVTVVVAYVVTLVIVTLLGVDPMSAARDAASSLTSAGERAVEEREADRARAARRRGAAQAEKPLTERLDYRIYRTIAEGKARVVPYAQIAFDKVFGGRTVEDRDRRHPGSFRRGRQTQDRLPLPTPEPDGKVLRS